MNSVSECLLLFWSMWSCPLPICQIVFQHLGCHLTEIQHIVATVTVVTFIPWWREWRSYVNCQMSSHLGSPITFYKTVLKNGQLHWRVPFTLFTLHFLENSCTFTWVYFFNTLSTHACEWLSCANGMHCRNSQVGFVIVEYLKTAQCMKKEKQNNNNNKNSFCFCPSVNL